MLSQEQDGRVRPIAYASRALTRAERNMENYSSRKLELLALKWAITEKFREHLHCKMKRAKSTPKAKSAPISRGPIWNMLGRFGQKG